MTRTAISLAALIALSFIGASASAQEATTVSMCGKRADMVDALSKDFKELPMAVGQVDPSAVVEVFVSDSGTWTILATRTDGSSCIVSAGEGWQSHTLVAGKDA